MTAVRLRPVASRARPQTNSHEATSAMEVQMTSIPPHSPNVLLLGDLRGSDTADGGRCGPCGLEIDQGFRYHNLVGWRTACADFLPAVGMPKESGHEHSTSRSHRSQDIWAAQ
ncbi:MAG: hypothetical protein A2W31_13125 [Planctomycetes bacterium RBG_16_64_10]|nr:MAG: hypothetical protein A2W31_13125 [Planctomycetes bacterium RBG_16_64_10]